ncbi:MAG: hypothetical protein SFY95_10385 [Planctomycetota bacterium]|nr:hypothetical protein [Planctomycetota bacterium]
MLTLPARSGPTVGPTLGLAAAALALPVWAQPPAQAPAQPSGQPESQDISNLPAPVKLAIRVSAVRSGIPAAPVVVVVRDVGSYVEAIARWSPKLRYPVLIDDGTEQAREDLARFVRAYQPQKVMRWSFFEAKGPKATLEDQGLRERLVARAVVRAWGTPLQPDDKPSIKDQVGMFRQAGLTSPGIVICSPPDAAWTGGLALAAGHAQPIAWLWPILGPALVMQPDDADLFSRDIEKMLQATGLPYDGLGDAIDAITLACAAPARLKKTERDMLALTDRLGRAGTTASPGAPWAWTGQVMGSNARSAYSAMCSLFLAPTSAWIFDGYPDTAPWNTYGGAKAAEAIKESARLASNAPIDWKITVDGPPNGSASAWRMRASRALDASLVLINTKGNSDFFDLEPGRGKPADVPMLARPAAVHIVHSWSAEMPGERNTIAGRWFERGAFAYFGSVQEPFLQAFVPTPDVAARLAALIPWGPAVRHTNAPAWKVATFGDPLLQFGPVARSESTVLPLENPEDVQEELRAALKDRKFEAALDVLALQGRDADAVRLARGLLAETTVRVEPGAARAMFMPLIRAGEAELAARAMSLMSREDRALPARQDALWLIAHPLLGSTDSRALIETLRESIRSDVAGRDAADLAPAIARVFGSASARRMLEEARTKITDDRTREEFDKVIRGLPQ